MKQVSKPGESWIESEISKKRKGGFPEADDWDWEWCRKIADTELDVDLVQEEDDDQTGLDLNL